MTVRPASLVFLDAGILSLLAHPRGGDQARAARSWARGLLEGGIRLFVAEIIDYEVRRELTRTGATASLRGLDDLRVSLDFAPVTTPTMILASQLWAESRRRGQSTCHPKSLDGDVILAATALTAAGSSRLVVIASSNRRHLSQFLPVAEWSEIEIFRPALSPISVPLPSA